MISYRNVVPALMLSTLLTACATQPQTAMSDASSATGACQALKAVRGLALSNLQVTSWNVYKGAKVGWQTEMDALDTPNTLFLLQEALHGSALLKELGAQQRWHFSPGYETEAGLSGVLTTAAVNAQERCILFHKEPWLRSPKASLITRYRLQGSPETLLVANVHAINFTVGTNAYREQLGDVVALLREHTGPMLVAGDFNTWSKRRQRVLDETIAELGLRRVHYDAEQLKKVFGNPLDHLYYRGLALRHAEAKATDTSDHSLLTARFDIATEI